MGISILISAIMTIFPTIAKALMAGGSFSERALAGLSGVLGDGSAMTIENILVAMQGLKEDQTIQLVRLENTFKAEIAEIEGKLGEKTIEMDEMDAESPNPIRYGWRPVLEWLCDLAMANWILINFMIVPYLALYKGLPIENMPVATIITLICYFLGYGGLPCLTNESGSAINADKAMTKILNPKPGVIQKIKRWFWQ